MSQMEVANVYDGYSEIIDKNTSLRHHLNIHYNMT